MISMLIVVLFASFFVWDSIHAWKNKHYWIFSIDMCIAISIFMKYAKTLFVGVG